MTTKTTAPSYPVPPPDAQAPKGRANDQDCQKCGAVFRWQPESEREKAPLVLRLVTGSAKCDCGFGKPRRK